MYEKSLGIRHFRVFPYSKEAEVALACAARAAGDRRMKRTASTEALGCRMEAGQDPKTDICANTLPTQSGRTCVPGIGRRAVCRQHLREEP